VKLARRGRLQAPSSKLPAPGPTTTGPVPPGAWSLEPGAWSLLFQAALVVAAVRLGLWMLPFRRLRAGMARLATAPPLLRPGEGASTDEIARAVARASRYVPRASCLTQALATQALLRWRGIPAHLHIGVAKAAEGRLEAHAWVESQGRIVIGGSALGRYTPLLVLTGDPPGGLRARR
jgi:Transglutaminase-like superfamily